MFDCQKYFTKNNFVYTVWLDTRYISGNHAQNVYNI